MRQTVFSLAVVCVVGMFASPAHAIMTTELVEDINPLPLGSSPRDYVLAGAHVFFTAETFLEGRELWRCDPDGGNPELVRDIRVGKVE